MEARIIEKENGNIALFTSEEILLRDTQDILDLMAEVYQLRRKAPRFSHGDIRRQFI